MSFSLGKYLSNVHIVLTHNFIGLCAQSLHLFIYNYLFTTYLELPIIYVHSVHPCLDVALSWKVLVILQECIWYILQFPSRITLFMFHNTKSIKCATSLPSLYGIGNELVVGWLEGKRNVYTAATEGKMTAGMSLLLWYWWRKFY